MKRDNTAWGPTPAASLQWREGTEPFSTAFEDIYYSRENGLAESRHVFLAGNDLPARWQNQRQDTHFCIAETGFGTGLNFLQTWQAWRERSRDIEAPALYRYRKTPSGQTATHSGAGSLARIGRPGDTTA